MEVEVESLDQLDAALRAQPNMVLLDNMPPDLMREAVRRRNAVAPAVLLEAGSIVNRDEELAMASPERQALISASVAQAVEIYCSEQSRRSAAATPPNPAR